MNDAGVFFATIGFITVLLLALIGLAAVIGACFAALDKAKGTNTDWDAPRYRGDEADNE